jgi:hypothetical protein
MAKSQGVPPAGWESSLLQQLGDPDTQASEQFFDDWAQAEHGNTKVWGTNGTGMAYNPFDTTLQEPGAVPGNSVGVENYVSWAQGESATVSTLEQSNMSPLQQALRSGSSTEAELEQAEGQTPWGHEPSWPSGTPRFGSGSSSGSSGSPLNLNGWQGLGYGPTPVAPANPGSPSSPTPSSPALLTAAPWGGLLGSQIEEAVFFLLGAALVIVGLVITFKSGNEDNPSAAPIAKEASHAEEGAELAAA